MMEDAPNLPALSRSTNQSTTSMLLAVLYTSRSTNHHKVAMLPSQLSDCYAVSPKLEHHTQLT